MKANLIPAAALAAGLYAGIAGAQDEPRQFECLIEPNLLVEVSSPVEGVIQTIAVDKADAVTTGQVLATLESSVQEAAVEQARAKASMDGAVKAAAENLDLSRKKLKRIEDLFSTEAIASQQLDEAKTETNLARLELQKAREEKKVAELELEQAMQALDKRTIRSPIDGVVVQRFVSQGESVKDKPVVSIAQIDPLRVEVILPASRFGSIKVGTQAEILPEISGGRSYAAHVTIVDRVIDAASGTYGVRLELPNPEYALPGGLNCQVTFRTDLPLHAANEVESKPEPSRPVETAATPEPATPDDELSVTEAFSQAAGLSIGKNPRCYRFGPIVGEQRLQQVRAVLLPVADELRNSSSPNGGNVVEGYYVLTGTQESAEQARELAQELKDAGLGDVAAVVNGAFKNRVSLGVFSSEANARRRQQQAGAAEVPTELLPRNTAASSTMLRFSISNRDLDLTALRNELVSLVPRARIEPDECP